MRTETVTGSRAVPAASRGDLALSDLDRPADAAMTCSADPSPGPGLSWLNRWQAHKGRPLRVLHIGNIANNGYNNARIQRQHGIEADVICYDYYHVMSSPEWEDANFHGDIGDPDRPDWTRVDLKGFQRPEWFAQGPLALCQDYLVARQRGEQECAGELWVSLGVINKTKEGDVFGASSGTLGARLGVLRARSVGIALCEDLESPVRRRLSQILPGNGSGPQRLRGWLLPPLLLGAGVARALLVRLYRWGLLGGREKARDLRFDSVVADLIGRFRREFPDRLDPMIAQDLEIYRDGSSKWSELFSHYDVIQGYSTDGIHPLIARRPYVAFEHGTIREIPFEATRQGRICALVYRQAEWSFVTNSDNLEAADRLGLDPARVVCLPHPFDHQRVINYGDRRGSSPLDAESVLFFSPSRQHWRQQRTSMGKGNDLIIRASARLVSEGRRFRVRFVEWGQEVDLSKALIEDLGCESVFEWVPQMRKTELWDNYLDCHCVIDQLVIPAIGGVTFEAMTLGRPVITRIDAPVLERFFGEAPPVLCASTVDETAAAMQAIIEDPGDVAGLGGACQRWIRDFHSSGRVVELQARAYQHLMEKPDRSASVRRPVRHDQYEISI